MTGRRAGRRPPLEISLRDPRPIAAAVIIPSLIYAFVTVFLLAAAAGALDEGWRGRLLQLATVLGRGVLTQQGWVFGILITIQVGCLIALLGGQINAENRRVEATLRDALSLFSVIPVVALSPALTVAVIAAFRVGELRGNLFVIIPVLALTVGLSIFIGALDNSDDLTKLELAREEEMRAAAQLGALRVTQDAPFARTVLRRSAVLILLAISGSFVLNAASDGFSWPVWAYAVFSILIGCNISAAVVGIGVVNAAFKPLLGMLDVAFAIVGSIALCALHVASAVVLFALAWQFGAPFVLAGLLLIVDWIRVLLEAREVRAGRRPTGFWRSGGALARAGTSSAKKAAESDRDRALRRIVALEEKIDRHRGRTSAAPARHRGGAGQREARSAT